jgi:hypothetical protein
MHATSVKGVSMILWVYIDRQSRLASRVLSPHLGVNIRHFTIVSLFIVITLNTPLYNNNAVSILRFQHLVLLPFSPKSVNPGVYTEAAVLVVWGSMSAPVSSDTTLLTEHLTYRPAVSLAHKGSYCHRNH